LDFPGIYQAMRQTEMNEWVGGADPELTGKISAAILLKYLPIDGTSQVLDFGVGIGRVALSVLKHRPALKLLLGIDIVSRMVDFCRSNIGSQFPNTRFELLADNNPHYERFKERAGPRARAELLAAYGGSIDCAYAFSVFTHIDKAEFAGLLRFIGGFLKPGGHLLFTVFALSPFSRQQIVAGRTSVPLPTVGFEEQDTIFVPNPADRLAFIAYDTVRIEQMVTEAGLIPSQLEYGGWRGDKFSGSFQDVVVCRKPLA
jgi:SAM-dependent methyltransferase